MPSAAMTGPESVPRIMHAWDQALDAVIAIGAGLAPQQWSLPTECPAWSVKDVYAHLAGIEDWYGDGRPALPDKDALTDAPVRARRNLDGRTVLAALRFARGRRRAWLAAHCVEPDDARTLVIPGQMPTWQVLSIRATDVWFHEQDIRRAVGQPGDLDTEAARIAAMVSRAGLPGVAQRAGVPAGGMVRVTVTGPVALDAWVLADADGRSSEVAPERLPAETAPTVWLTFGTEDFLRLVGGRILPANAMVQVIGDQDLAAMVLANLTMTP
jgi:uncharacterized protein (TIGR03083 family)